MSQTELLSSFQSITGLKDEQCKKILKTANWNLEVALTSYFDSGAAPPKELNFSAVVNQPKPPEPVIQEERDEINLELIPSLYTKEEKLVPLQGMNINANVIDFIADVDISQRFVNEDKQPIEAIFQFEQHDCTLHHFEVEVDGKKFIGVAKEKKRCFQ